MRIFRQLTPQTEIAPTFQLPEGGWLSHADDAAGCCSLPLISAAGGANIDYALAGPVAATNILHSLPAIATILRQLNVPLARSRLVRLPARSSTEPQLYNATYHHYRRHTLIVPLVTTPDVLWVSGDEAVQMAAGTCWSVASNASLQLVNDSFASCVHLVVESKQLPSNKAAETLQLEPFLFELLIPSEMNALLAHLSADLPSLTSKIQQFEQQWKVIFGRFQHHPRGELSYRNWLARFNSVFKRQRANLSTQGNWAFSVISSQLRRTPKPPLTEKKIARAKHKMEPRRFPVDEQLAADYPLIRPIFLVSAPRAGSTLLFDKLTQLPDVWSTGRENHRLVESIDALHPSARGFASNQLIADDATAPVSTALRGRFHPQLIDRDGQPLTASEPQPIRMLDKTPKNALRIPFWKAIFPDAQFIFLYRDPRQNISSMIEGWQQERFVPYRRLPNWPHTSWNFLLTPGWETHQDCSIAEIATHQWCVTNQMILDGVDSADFCFVTYQDLVTNPQATLQRIARFADLRWDAVALRQFEQLNTTTHVTLSAPHPDKWRKNEWQLDPLTDMIQPIEAQVAQLNAQIS